MSAGKNARLTALKALLRVEEGKGYSNLVLDHGLAASGPVSYTHLRAHET